jgi:hypothetical protein
MNTEHNTHREAFESFAEVAAPRRPLTRSDLELQRLSLAERGKSLQSERSFRGTAPHAAYFIEVYVARPVSRVPGCSSAMGDPLA